MALPLQDMSKINKDDAEELGWAVAECLAESVNMAEAGKLIMTLYKGGKDLGGALDQGLVPNPYFVNLGLSAPAFKKTKGYLDARAKKNFAASLFKWGGSAASTVTVVDVGTASLGGQAVALTSAHAVKLVGLRTKYTNKEFRGYIDICLEAKAVKGVSRAGETVMALIPGACIAAKIGMAAAQAVGKLGMKVTLHKALDRAAQLLHMHAHLEASDSGARPATELWEEIFAKRGATSVFGKYDVPGLISESCGWMTLSDKLKLI